jgi:protein MPE1
LWRKRHVNVENYTSFVFNADACFIGHWIQVCPTNDDPSFDGRPRVKRTTGIPRSFLKTIEKPTVAPGDGISEESKQPVGVMVNAEGEWVIAEPDKASWDNYQAKAKASVAAREAAALGSKELQERGLECSIDKRLFEEPTKTPCCQSTYCHDCITNALLENDLRCPNCSAENVLIDNLEPDNEIVAKIRSYREEQEANKPQEDASNSPRKDVPLPKLQKKPNSLSPNGSVSESSNTSDANSASKVKKRPAESELENDRISSGPLRLSVMVAGQQHTSPQSIAFSGGPVSSQSSFAPHNYTMIQGMNMMPLSNMNGYGGFPMTLVPSMAMNPAMLNAMMMQGLSSMGAANSSWASSWEAGVSQQSCTNAAGAGVRNADYGQRHYYGPMGHGFINTVSSNQVSGGFSNQERTAISTQNLNEEDSAYFRKPVNPHRHQARRNVNRPTDYREI